MRRKIFSILAVLVVVLTFSLVTAVPAAAATINVPASYATIQAAINAASPGDIIVVAAGTYTEDLTVNTANLTIRSATGMAVTTIQLVDGVGIDIQAGATNFTLGGASGQGFTILSGAGTTFNIQLANAPAGVTISYNTINTTGSATMGISVGAAGATGLTISNNTFTAEVNDGSIWGPKVVNVTVSTNTMTGPSASPAGGYAVEFAGVTGTSTISSNTITNYSMGVAIFHGEGTSGLTISGNTFTGCKNGIRLGQYTPTTSGDMTTVTITQNTFATSTIAIRIGDGANVLASQFTITNNNISGSITWGLQNEHTSQAVTAESNWWGSANGPVQTGNTFNVGSQGDAISATSPVDYVPWLNGVYGTGTSFAPVKNITDDPDTLFSSILAAINAGTTADGETITCAAGTYNGAAESFPIAISKGIILQSVAGAATTIIDPGANGQGAIAISHDSVTLDGFTIKQGTEAVTAGNPQEHTVWVAAEYSTIKNNTIIGSGGNQACIYIGGRTGNTPTGAVYGYQVATPKGHTIQDNTFRYGTATAGSGEGWGIFAYDLSDSLIHGNIFVGDAADVGAWNTNEGAPGTGIIIHKATAAVGTPSPGGGYVVIENNTARYLKYTFLTFYAAYQYVDAAGGGYEQPEASTVDKVIVQNNTVYDCGTTTAFASGTAVNFHRAKKNDAYGVKGADLTVGTNDVVIGPGNTFYNLDYGVKVDAPTACTDSGGYACVLDADNIVVKYNAIYNSASYGLYNGTIEANQEGGGAKTIVAQYNWWGTAAGAYHATTNPGVAGKRGATVTDSVTYIPWLFLTTAANSGDTVANIDANQVPAYAKSIILSSGWNTFSVPIALDGQYNSWGELYTLTSLPYTVAYRFDIASQTFESLATTSTYALAPGEAVYVKLTATNSIPYCYSTLFSIPSRALSANWNLIGGGLTVKTEINTCISIATSGSTSGYTHIISPAENAVPWIYIAGAGTANDIALGEGYWVFLPIARTLGLFDLTPVVWVP
jgi:hypothetical protein